MTLNIDLAKALRGNQLGLLVAAVRTADKHDESRSVEWKSTLDLTSRHAHAHIARAIIGFANRDPDVATTEFEGLGYVLVGVEPGNVEGVVSRDLAELTRDVAKYTGSGPAWTPLPVLVDGRTVMVFAVEAPRPGDAIHCFVKEGETGGRTIPAGTIYVRHPGETRPATPDDLANLQKRLLARSEPTPNITVEALTVDGAPLAWFDPVSAPAEFRAIAARRGERLIMKARDRDRTLHPERYEPPSRPTIAHLAGLAGAIPVGGFGLASVSGSSEERSVEEYEAAVLAWQSDWADAAAAGMADIFSYHDHGSVEFRVHNLTDRNLKAAAIRLRFGWEGVAGDEDPAWPHMPAPPREYGRTWVDEMANLGRSLTLPVIPSGGHYIRNSWIEEGSVIVAVKLGDIYPHDHAEADPVQLLVSERPPDGLLRGTWQLRAKNLDQVVRGSVVIPVADTPTGAERMLRPAATEDKS